MVRTIAIPTRSLIWLMLFTCTLMVYLLRINLPIIILAMVENTGTKNYKSECIVHSVLNVSNVTNLNMESKLKNYGVKYDWNTKLQGYILSSYFWGMIIGSTPGGWIGGTYGPKKSITTCFIISGILTSLGPQAASLSPYALIASRFLLGILGGIIYPCCYCILSRWSPPDEAGIFSSVYLGASVSTIVGWPLLSVVIESFGWAWSFYVSGIIVFVWLMIWWLVVTDSPDCHPRISEEERRYIVESLGNSVSNEKQTPPYKDIFLSSQAWGLFILYFGHLYGLLFLLTEGPNFVSNVLGFNLENTGFLSVLPHITRVLSGFAFGAVVDLILRRNWMGKTRTRKFFIIFSHIIPGLFLLVQTLSGCDPIWALAILAVVLNGSSTITNLINSNDLSPNFSGTLCGISNTFGGIAGIISPVVVGYMTSEHNGLKEWHQIFYITAAIYIGSGLIFWVIGSGEIQPWNDKKKQGKSIEEQN